MLVLGPMGVHAATGPGSDGWCRQPGMLRRLPLVRGVSLLLDDGGLSTFYRGACCRRRLGFVNKEPSVPLTPDFPFLAKRP